MCLEQWSWIASIASSIVAIFVLILTFVGFKLAWRYGHAPSIITRIVLSTDRQRKPLGLRIREDLLTDIRVQIINLKRSIAPFKFSVKSWFNRKGLNFEPVEPEYRGETVRVSRPGEPIEGHFFIDISTILNPLIHSDRLTPQTDVKPIIEYFKQNTFYISTKTSYVGFLANIFRLVEPTFEYYFVPVPVDLPYIPRGNDEQGRFSIFIPGYWVLGGPR